MTELETTYNKAYQAEFDYKNVLESKGLTSTLEALGENMTKNRFVCSYIQSTSALQANLSKSEIKDLDATDYIKLNNKIMLPKGNLSTRKFAVLITAKSVNISDSQKNYDIDDSIISNKDLPHWMSCECMYMFDYQDIEDNSSFQKKMDTSDFLSIEFHNDSFIKQGYTFRVEISDKVLFFNTQSALECEKWVTLLKKSKAISNEIKHSKYNCISKNVDKLVWKWVHEKLNLEQKAHIDIDSMFFGWILESSTLERFIQIYGKAINNMDHTTDALQAHRPFYKDLYKTYLQSSHIILCGYLSEFWGKRMKEFETHEILKF